MIKHSKEDEVVRAIVLGGCGFIGTHIVDSLLAEGHTVAVFGRSMEHYRSKLPNVDYITGDFLDKMALTSALSGVDVIFHLINTTVPGTANGDPISDVSDNLIGTLNLIDVMNSLRIRRIVYLSSGGTVYGHTPPHPISENYPLNPINSYGIVKATVERYLEMYRSSHGLQPLSIRAANPFGPRQSQSGIQGVVATFMRRIYYGQPIDVWGDGRVVRDYFFVNDLASLCVNAASGNLCGAINAGSGQGKSLLDLIDALSEVTGQRSKINFKPGRKIDVPYSVLDIRRAEVELNWQPRTDFHCGLKKTWEWVQENAK